MSKRKLVTDQRLLSQLREMADDFRFVKVSTRALRDMQQLGINLRGVCDALCDYLDAGGRVDETVPIPLTGTSVR